jgi:hypothetical protein
LSAFGADIGLAFQIQDRILDASGETRVLGRSKDADAALGKPTYPSVIGLEGPEPLQCGIEIGPGRPSMAWAPPRSRTRAPTRCNAASFAAARH